MFGEKLEQMTTRCRVCLELKTLNIDLEDYSRWREGMVIQEAFTDRECRAYLTDEQRELLLSAICGQCWVTLFPEEEEEDEVTVDDQQEQV